MEPLMTPLQADLDLDEDDYAAAAATVRLYARDDVECATFLDMLGLE